MAEEQGGTSGEAKTFTEAEMTAALTTAKAEGNKEGQTSAYTHWQSVNDKAISQLRTEGASELADRDSTIAVLRKAQLEAMDPADRSVALMEDVQKMLAGKGANDASDKPGSLRSTDTTQSDKVSGQDDSSGLAQVRKEVGLAIKEKYGNVNRLFLKRRTHFRVNCNPGQVL